MNKHISSFDSDIFDLDEQFQDGDFDYLQKDMGGMVGEEED